MVDLYVDDHPDAEHLRGLAEEIDNLRASRPELDVKRVHVVHRQFLLLPNPLPYRDWLGEVAHRLRQHADGIERNAAFQR